MKPNPMGRLEMHQDTRLLLAYLRQRLVKDGQEFVCYKDLTAAIGGRDVQREARGLLTTARKHLMHGEGILLEAIPGEGLRRHKSPQEYGHKSLCKAGRTARRATQGLLAALELTEVSNEDRVATCAEISLLGAIGMLTKPRACKLIEARIAADAPKELPTADVLRAQFESV